MKQQILCTALAAVLLTGCSSEPLVNMASDTTAPPAVTHTTETSDSAQTSESSSTVTAGSAPAVSLTAASGSEPAVTTMTTASAAETQPAGNTPQFVIVPATAGTFAPVTTQKTVTSAAIPDYYYDLQFAAPVNLYNVFSPVRNYVAVAGKGLIYAKNGASLYDKPSSKGKQLAALKAGTNVEILGVAEDTNADDYFRDYEKYPNTEAYYKVYPHGTSDMPRWYHVKADGKEGYVSAYSTAAKFSQTVADDMSLNQMAAIGTYLYYQAQDLFVLFAREGGFKGSGRNSSDSFSAGQNRYEQMQPSTLKLSDIYSEFYEYFSPNYNKDILMPKDTKQPQYYAEKNGKLYTCTSFTSFDKKYREYSGDIFSHITETLLQGVDWVTEIEHQGNDSTEHRYTNEYTLVYEDGVWKIGKFFPLYSPLKGALEW